jgi:hypothetical protein
LIPPAIWRKGLLKKEVAAIQVLIEVLEQKAEALIAVV